MNRNYLAALGAIVALILVGGGLYGCPQYQVYQQRLTGEAELAGADYNRQVAVREHRPKRTPRAYWPKPKSPALRGWRKRIRSLATACPGNEAYLRYLWIDKMEDAKPQVIYVPTETGLPILEAGRRP